MPPAISKAKGGADALNAFIEFKERHGRKRISSQVAFMAGIRYAENFSIPYGYHWEIVHDKSGDVVNSGFTRTDPPPVGPIQNPKGFTMRVTAVKRIAE